MKRRGLLAQRQNRGLQNHEVPWSQLAVKVSLCAHNGKRNFSPVDFFRAEPQADHDGEHAVADRCEIVLHVHVAKMVAVRRGDGGPVCLYKDHHTCSPFLATCTSRLSSVPAIMPQLSALPSREIGG